MSDGPLTDRKQLTERRKRDKALRAQRKSDFAAVMARAEGRRFVWRLINEVAGTMNGSFTGEALGSAYAEGRRAVGRELMVEAQQVSTALYVDMVREAISELEQPVDPSETPDEE